MGLQANELRIGNFVTRKASGNVIAVNTGIIQNILENRDKEYEPIPLTSEILKSAGWQKGSENFWHKKGVNGWIIDKDIKGNLFLVKGEKVIIKHLHQLQNIFHSLTGEELEIKR